MKKVAFTLGLAFFAIGLFAQTASGSATKATPAAATAKKEPLKPNSMQNAHPAPGTSATAPASSAKPATMPAAKHTENPSAKATSATHKPAASTATSTTPKKHHRAHHKKAQGATGSDAAKSTAAPKKN